MFVHLPVNFSQFWLLKNQPISTTLSSNYPWMKRNSSLIKKIKDPALSQREIIDNQIRCVKDLLFKNQ